MQLSIWHNKKIKLTAKSVINFAKRRKIYAPFIRRLFWRYVLNLFNILVFYSSSRIAKDNLP